MTYVSRIGRLPDSADEHLAKGRLSNLPPSNQTGWRKRPAPWSDLAFGSGQRPDRYGPTGRPVRRPGLDDLELTRASTSERRLGDLTW